MAESATALHESLLEYALTLPEAWEDHPWGDTVVKVRKKIFVFLGVGHEKQPARISVKLPESADHALSLPEAVPTGYGLGRSGWVTVPLVPGVPGIDVLKDWLRESYVTVAPKTLAARLLAGPADLA